VKLVENVGLISPHFHIYLDDNIYDKKVEHLEKILSCNYQGHIVSVKGGETAYISYFNSTKNVEEMEPCTALNILYHIFDASPDQ
jgi:hypothetical protein